VCWPKPGRSRECRAAKTHFRADSCYSSGNNVHIGRGHMVIAERRGIDFSSGRSMMRGLLTRLWLTCLILLGAACVAVIGPQGPPPHGQIWVESGGQWALVPAPPSDGPYVWVGGSWVPETTAPPTGADWVPGHWGPRGWVPGHWALVPAAGPGAVWVVGHWRGGVWVPGHWQGGPAGKQWVPGHRGPRGRWNPGHWR